MNLRIQIITTIWSSVRTMIRLHMRSHGFDGKKWNDSAVRRLMRDAGSEENLNMLSLIFKSDCTTKNEKRKMRREKNVDSLVTFAEEVLALDKRKSLRPTIDGNEVMDITGLSQGRELGLIMKFLNSDEGIVLNRSEAINAVISMSKNL